MKSRQSPLLLVALLPLLFAGCAPQRGDFPSLLPRPIEDRSDAVAVAAPVEVQADPALDSRIAALTATLDQSQRSFETVAERAERLGESAVTVGGDGWIEAQVALAELDTLRAPVVGVVSELEALAIDRGVAGTLPYPALDAAIARARAVNDAQVARIRAIEAALAPA